MKEGKETRDPNTAAAASVSARVFVILMVAATLVRAAGFASHGTSDMMDFVIWAYHGATHGPTTMYGVGEVESRELEYGGYTSSPDYPPVALYELAGAATLCRAAGCDLENPGTLRAVVKLLVTAGDAVIALLVWLAVRKRWGSAAARIGALACWANPAMILHSSVLGYLGSLAAAPAIAALLLASGGWTAASGALLAVAGLTKPQGVFVAPAILFALIVWRQNPLRPNPLAGNERQQNARAALTRATLGGAVASAVIIMPFVIRGTAANMFEAVFGLIDDGTLSAWAANAWWIAGYAAQSLRAMSTAGASAWFQPAVILEAPDLLNFQRVPRLLGSLIVSGVGWTIVLGVIVWAVRLATRFSTAARADARTRTDVSTRTNAADRANFAAADEPATQAAIAALTVHTYFVFAPHVHENHMWDVIPLVALFAASRRVDRRLLGMLSVIVFLNLNLFYGLGENVGFAIPRSLTVIDASVVLAAINVLAWAWHLRLFRSRFAGSPAPVPVL